MNFKTGDIVKVAGSDETLYTFLRYDKRFPDNSVSVLSNGDGWEKLFFTNSLYLAEDEVDEL